jgi:hypothetical protein
MVAVLVAMLLVAVACGDVSAIADESGAPTAGADESLTAELAAQVDSGDGRDGNAGLAAPAADDDQPDQLGQSEVGADSTADRALGGTTLGAPGSAATASGSLGDDNGSELAALISELPAAPIGEPVPEAAAARPTLLTIESLGVRTAAVIGVGIEPNGDMEVPPADEVGWYQYGPSPGQEGSSVLAAHIAYDGRDGVFVNLDDLELGAIIEVLYDDGTARRFEATDKQQYDKNELPRESVFGRTGEPQLVLITCGGDFNRNLRSYEDNVVVYARPIA